MVVDMKCEDVYHMTVLTREKLLQKTHYQLTIQRDLAG